ncbi:probable uridine nucleosidase 2 [Haliotis rufescens]|uniref:probable uridine nucleosidase 2 n=1 Tax=Haliotis rufescens TaxID=6454 RepID=UPI00201E7685|nr:probable uridine nucleosidase 2 [Haliotis rufescens]
MRKVVIDADTGVDDAVAIMYAFSSPNIEVLAITCTWGNTSLENSCRNAARVVNLCGKQVPIYCGSDRALHGLVPDLKPDRFRVHGVDGLGNVDWEDTVDTDVFQHENAVVALTKMAKQHPGEISLVTLGSLTNVALAINLDPDFAASIKDMYIMGGNIDGLGEHVLKEFNFSLDPEVDDLCLSNMKNIHILSRDVCDMTEFTKEWMIEQLKVKTAKANFIKRILLERMTSPVYINIRICDFALMVAIAHPEAVTASEKARAVVELSGKSRSLLKLDWGLEDSNVTMYKSLRYDMLMDAFRKLLND